MTTDPHDTPNWDELFDVTGNLVYGKAMVPGEDKWWSVYYLIKDPRNSSAAGNKKKRKTNPIKSNEGKQEVWNDLIWILCSYRKFVEGKNPKALVDDAVQPILGISPISDAQESYFLAEALFGGGFVRVDGEELGCVALLVAGPPKAKRSLMVRRLKIAVSSDHYGIDEQKKTENHGACKIAPRLNSKHQVPLRAKAFFEQNDDPDNPIGTAWLMKAADGESVWISGDQLGDKWTFEHALWSVHLWGSHLPESADDGKVWISYIRTEPPASEQQRLVWTKRLLIFLGKEGVEDIDSDEGSSEDDIDVKGRLFNKDK